jgi:hypothetical protein
MSGLRGESGVREFGVLEEEAMRTRKDWYGGFVGASVGGSGGRSDGLGTTHRPIWIFCSGFRN